MKTPRFEYCSVCYKKIGFFRKLQGDTSCMGLIPSNQFCSDKCNKIGLEMLLNKIKNKEKNGKRQRNVKTKEKNRKGKIRKGEE